MILLLYVISFGILVFHEVGAQCPQPCPVQNLSTWQDGYHARVNIRSPVSHRSQMKLFIRLVFNASPRRIENLHIVGGVIDRTRPVLENNTLLIIFRPDQNIRKGSQVTIEFIIKHPAPAPKLLQIKFWNKVACSKTCQSSKATTSRPMTTQTSNYQKCAGVSQLIQNAPGFLKFKLTLPVNEALQGWHLAILFTRPVILSQAVAQFIEQRNMKYFVLKNFIHNRNLAVGVFSFDITIHFKDDGRDNPKIAMIKLGSFVCKMNDAVTIPVTTLQTTTASQQHITSKLPQTVCATAIQEVRNLCPGTATKSEAAVTSITPGATTFKPITSTTKASVFIECANVSKVIQRAPGFLKLRLTLPVNKALQGWKLAILFTKPVILSQSVAHIIKQRNKKYFVLKNFIHNRNVGVGVFSFDITIHFKRDGKSNPKIAIIQLGSFVCKMNDAVIFPAMTPQSPTTTQHPTTSRLPQTDYTTTIQEVRTLCPVTDTNSKVSITSMTPGITTAMPEATTARASTFMNCASFSKVIQRAPGFLKLRLTLPVNKALQGWKLAILFTKPVILSQSVAHIIKQRNKKYFVLKNFIHNRNVGIGVFSFDITIHFKRDSKSNPKIAIIQLGSFVCKMNDAVIFPAMTPPSPTTTQHPTTSRLPQTDHTTTIQVRTLCPVTTTNLMTAVTKMTPVDTKKTSTSRLTNFQKCASVFRVIQRAPGFLKLKMTLPVNKALQGWKLAILFTKPVILSQAVAHVIEQRNGIYHVLKNFIHNRNLGVGIFSFDITIHFKRDRGSNPKIAMIKLGSFVCKMNDAVTVPVTTRQSPTTTQQQTTSKLPYTNQTTTISESTTLSPVTTTDLGSTGMAGGTTTAPKVTTVKSGEATTKRQSTTVATVTSVERTTEAATTEQLTTQSPLACTSKYDYGQVLNLSLLFYEAQRSGKLPNSNRIPYRKDSAMKDGQDVGLDLTGGYYDAGDFVKFGFPMAYTITVLAWGAIQYEDGYRASGQYQNMLDAIKWGTDYFIKCHSANNEFYGQVGDGDADHGYWGRPEDMTMNRPSMKIDSSKPGSDLAGETAAAFAAASIVFKSDAAYSQKLILHAKQLYDFADKFRGKYSDSIANAAKFYKSWSGFGDELTWAAAWMYRATKEAKYLTAAESFYSQFGMNSNPQEFSWDDKKAGVQVLMSQLTGKATYKTNVGTFCDSMLAKDTQLNRIVYISQWGTNRHAANVAFICLQAADLGIKSSAYKAFARKQIHCMLGDSGRSFVVGFGNNPPQRPHHRSSSCPNSPAVCDWNSYNSPAPNPHVLYGALVGGPDKDGVYEDRRNDYVKNEVACDYNAGFQSAVAGLRSLQMKGQC